MTIIYYYIWIIHPARIGDCIGMYLLLYCIGTVLTQTRPVFDYHRTLPSNITIEHYHRKQRRVMNTIAQRLVSMCATLGELPHVRFAADGRGRTEEVARIFQVGLYVCYLLSGQNWYTPSRPLECIHCFWGAVDALEVADSWKERDIPYIRIHYFRVSRFRWLVLYWMDSRKWTSSWTSLRHGAFVDRTTGEA